MKQIKLWLHCGHTTVQPDKVGKELHGQLWICPKCAREGMPVVYNRFVFDCGHNFLESPDRFNEWERQWKEVEGKEIGNCLECLYPIHRPISGQCEMCGKPISICQGTEMMCDACLPKAFGESLQRIIGLISANENIN